MDCTQRPDLCSNIPVQEMKQTGVHKSYSLACNELPWKALTMRAPTCWMPRLARQLARIVSAAVKTPAA
jgi:hypothetical protein